MNFDSYDIARLIPTHIYLNNWKSVYMNNDDIIKAEYMVLLNSRFMF